MSNTRIPGVKSPKTAFNLITGYFFRSDQKLVAWLLLIGAVICVIGLVALMAGFAWWSAGFWAVLSAKALVPFLYSMGQFSLLIAGYAGTYVLRNFFIGKLSILWRNWQTKQIMEELYDETNFLELKRTSPEIDNVGQRIQEDVKAFIDLTLNLGTDFLNSTLTLVTFIGSLWVIGGPLAFIAFGLNIVIPGYLVWVALLVAITATVITHFIGKSLPAANKNLERAEADFRQELTQFNENAENIAEEHAENYYKTTLENRIQTIKETANKKLDTQTKLTAFQNFYSQLGEILPNILAAPLYFSGLIEISQLMQIGMSFGQVSMALNWFANSYENLSMCKASIQRIIELQTDLEKEASMTNPKLIERTVRNKDSIKIKDLNIAEPKKTSSMNYILRMLNLKLKPGEHVLIKGRSGMGKSTLFKILSGTWKYGDGKVRIPSGKSFYFLPQRPTLPSDTLKAVLAYPEKADTYTEDEYIAALTKVGGMTNFIGQLDVKRDWSTLSGGEKQRISFARVLLKKPDWLFLDEATSALDEESEEHVYRTVKTVLSNTTIVSIAHRSTVEKHHSKILFFHANNDREVEISEQQVSHHSVNAFA